MTFPATADVTVVTAPAAADHHSYVDWPAIIAGVVLASAISIVLLTFGSAIGLSFTNFQAREGVSPLWVAIAAASWLLWVQVSSFMAGGYLTGRMRRRAGDATEHEVDVRDGAHGLLVWAGALVIGAVLAVSGLGAAANAVGSAAATVTNAAANVAGGAAEGAASALDPNAYMVDTLFRAAPSGDAAATETPAAAAETPAAAPATDAMAATPVAPATDAMAATPATPATDTAATPAAGATTTPATPAATPAAPMEASLGVNEPAPDLTAVRGEASRILATGALSGEVSADDKAYLGQLVSQNTGLTADEATARVDQVMTSIDTAKQEALAAAETARKTGILAAFLVAASFLASAVGAYWAASMGGRHRDEGTAFGDMFRRY